jgi:hypothetical protein
MTVPYDTSAAPNYTGGGGGGGGSVDSVSGGDASIVASNPGGPDVTLVTGSLDQLASLHPAIAPVGFNGQRAVSLASGIASTDAATVGQLAPLAPLNSPVFTGTPTAPTGSPGDSSTQIATDAFVAAAVNAAVQGLAVKPSVQEATTAALPANTYSNGASGVGATLTAVLPGVLTVDGVTVTIGSRILVQDEVAAANNGIYTVTTLGTVSVAYILTRATDMNQAAEVPGAFVFTENGTVNAGAGFTVAGAGPYVIGTTAITWTQFSGAGEITAGAGLAKTGNVLSLGVLTTAGDLIIENATPAPARLPVGSAGQALGVSGGLPAWLLAALMLTSTAVAGFALVNGTPNIMTWTAPNDGNLHVVICILNLDVTSSLTGGLITAQYSLPNGSVNTPTQFASGQSSGFHTSVGGYIIEAGTTFVVSQATTVTAGAAVLWGTLIGF